MCYLINLNELTIFKLFLLILNQLKYYISQILISNTMRPLFFMTIILFSFVLFVKKKEK